MHTIIWHFYSQVFFAISSSFSMSVFSEGSYDSSRLKLHIKKALYHSYLILIPATAIMILFSNELLLIFGSRYSANGTTLLAILAISSIFSHLNSFYYAYLRVRMRLKRLLAITSVTTITILAVPVILMPTYGIISVGLAYLFGHGIVCLFILIRYWDTFITKSTA